MTKVIAFTNRKGGVGKSTHSVHCAAGLAASGWRVGLVDTDSQGHASLMLGMPDANGLYDVLIDKKALADVVQSVPPSKFSTPDDPAQGALFLLPSSDRTYRIPYLLQPQESFLFMQTLQDMGTTLELDLIVVDTNPTLNLFDGAVYLAVDGFVYVTECERLSLDGVTSAIAQLQAFAAQRQQYLGRTSHILGILPNKFRPNTRLHRRNIKLMADHFGAEMVWSPVNLQTLWAEATNSQELVYTYAPGGNEEADARAIAERVKGAVLAWEAVEAKS